MACTSGPSGEALLVIAALVSFQLAQDRSNDSWAYWRPFSPCWGTIWR